ncbi:Cupredoxin superfamily protein [Striga hermonthica]|uniref:Cupredoxin superfamily protein n=1 Tax=Striga hermonthica TaxID=68872 RepID=A0A9N7N027_STRHE|nr:Cupredoxin superfamily protein [Striga hermonthica]
MSGKRMMSSGATTTTTTTATHTLTLLLMMMIFQFQLGHGIWVPTPTTYTVGDNKGWSTGVTSWTDRKTFYVGDTLVFNYDKSWDSVYMVSENDYYNCNYENNDKKWNSGNDHILLGKTGMHYFISGYKGHCANNMKIAVNVHRSY